MQLTTDSLVISATFSAEPLAPAIRCLNDFVGVGGSLKFAPYNQVIQQLLDPSSILSTHSGNAVLLVRWNDWVPTNRPEDVEIRSHEFESAMANRAIRQRGHTLVIFTPPPADQDPSFLNSCNTAEARLSETSAKLTDVSVVTSKKLLQHYSPAAIHDPVALQTAQIPYTDSFYCGLAGCIVRDLHSLSRRTYKVLVLDADNTIWAGVCGEEGPHGVRVLDQHRTLQQKAVQLRDQGFLLSLCSKNEPDDVWAVFDKNKSMLLQRSHISAAKINWRPKSENIRALADEMGLGLDSFIFLDDNPLECAEVKANCPEVLTLHLPSKGVPEFLENVWAFDVTKKTTEEDTLRADRYAQEQQRSAVRTAAPSLREFLSQLELNVDFEEFSDANSERIVQLMQRTNQFNFSGLKLTTSQLRTQSGFSVRVSDKYGDYGLVGAVAYSASQHDFIIDAFMLSCRALGRGVEHQIAQHIAEKAIGRNKVKFRFNRTARNTPAWQFLSEISSSDSNKTFDTAEASVSELLVPVDVSKIWNLTAADSSPSTVNKPHQSTGSQQITEANSYSAPSEVMQKIAGELRLPEQIRDWVIRQSPPRPELEEDYIAPVNATEKSVVSICEEVLHLRSLGVNDSIKNLGGKSLQIVQIHSRLVREFGSKLSITELYTLPTIRAIIDRIESVNPLASQSVKSEGRAPSKPSHERESVAVIGLAGRFPGANSVSQLWKNITAGVSSIVDIADRDLNLPASSPLRSNPNLVRKAASVQDADSFDAKFFQVFPKEAQVMDPQHRLLLESSWHALEDAGYTPDAIDVPVGVFAGCYMNTYMLASMSSNPKLLESLANSFHGGDLLTELGNDKDYLATRISFLLNLRGPALTVQTACSTSLVAISQACQSLLLGQCDMALAGGATLKLPQNRGYLYTEGGMVAPDGVVRTFDANARGTVFGEGVGVVALKRTSDAIADGDDIYCVIEGYGLNNDGHAKMGYTAPSIDGQSQAIAMAHEQAGIRADSISYVEAHGTGTALGDPIEIDALTQAFRQTTEKSQFCAIGSVKTNIGHLDVAAGVTGLIKVCLSLRNQLLPPSLHFDTPNPNIDFESSPFFVNTQLQPWEQQDGPRRAGISSFGVGGTNAHIVVREAPTAPSIQPSVRSNHLVVLSARSSSALKQAEQQLADHLETECELNIADVASTLQTGRKMFNYSSIHCANSSQDAVQSLRNTKSNFVHQVRRRVPVVFMFPGQGSQHVNMARELYHSEPTVAISLDECFSHLDSHLDFDLREMLVSKNESSSTDEALKQTTVAQPAIFILSYSLAKWFGRFGVEPSRMIGHSVGEFVAATLSGVFSLEDALKIIAFRAKLMQDLPTGNMMAVRLPESELLKRLPAGIAIAAINSPNLCVVSGPAELLDLFSTELNSGETICRPLHTSHAFHSEMMAPAVEPMAELLRSIRLRAPQTPIVSSVTGQLLTDKEATNPMYWAAHLRETVRFADGLTTLMAQPGEILLEVGPGQVLSTLVRQHPECGSKTSVIPSLPHAKQTSSSTEHLMMSTGKLWQAGAEVSLSAFYDNEPRRRLHLPGYPFERQKYWFDDVECSSEESVVVDAEVCASSNPETVDNILEQSPVQPNQALAERIVQQQLQLMRQQLQAWRT